MSKYIQVITTTKTKAEAQKISKKLIKEKLAGCIQITGPTISTYSWKAKIKTHKEWLCVIKTKLSLFKKIKESIKEIHSYKTPEIIVIPIIAGDRDYLKWLNKELI